MSYDIKQIRSRVTNARRGSRMINPDGEVTTRSGKVMGLKAELSGPVAAAHRGMIRARATASWDRSERTLVEHAHDDLTALLARVDALETCLAKLHDDLAPAGQADLSMIIATHWPSIETLVAGVVRPDVTTAPQES
jgi:hypothetical protein